MRLQGSVRVAFAFLSILGFTAQIAHALVTLNDGTDKIFVSSTFSMGYDSNITASALGVSDISYGGSMAIVYQRRAGLIGVNANLGFSLNDFVKNKSYDTFNPSYSIELDKGTGRLTGDLTLSAVRSSQADAAVNLYDVSWNYGLGLNLHYPVIERYSFTVSLNYGLLDYTDTGGVPLVNLSTYAASIGLFYVLSEERDLFADYRYRYQQSSDSTSTTDNGVSLGVNGRIIWRINGSLSAGYDLRSAQGVSNTGVVDSGNYSGLWVTGSANINVARKLKLTAAISRDYSTTATNATTDTTSGTLDASYALTARYSFNTGVGGGINQFLGPFGYLTGTTIDRRDYYFAWHTGVNYTLNDHLSLGLAYLYFQNWSNLALASFSRDTVTLSLTTRW